MASRPVTYVARVQSRAPSQMSGLDVAGLLNRLVDRQHDDLQQARADATQREQSVRAEAKAEASQVRAGPTSVKGS